MKLLDSKPKRIVLNITPLIDVLFILIIFFVVSSTFLEQPGMKLDLPKASEAGSHKVEKAVLVISQGSKMFFDGKEISQDKLPETLKKAMKSSNNKNLIISADKSTTHGLIVKVMDIARQNGVAKLVISTEPE